MIGKMLTKYLLSLKSSNSQPACIIFANNMDPNEARQIIGPDLDPNCLTLILIALLKGSL